jgi:deoxyinosine 3'endonuclease (endonuclease V)
VVETVTHNTTAVYVGVFLTLGGIGVLKAHLRCQPSRRWAQ